MEQFPHIVCEDQPMSSSAIHRLGNLPSVGSEHDSDMGSTEACNKLATSSVQKKTFSNTWVEETTTTTNADKVLYSQGRHDEYDYS